MEIAIISLIGITMILVIVTLIQNTALKAANSTFQEGLELIKKDDRMDSALQKLNDLEGDDRLDKLSQSIKEDNRLNSIQDKLQQIQKDDRIDLMSLEVKSLKMKLVMIEASLHHHVEKALSLDSPEWILSNGSIKKHFTPGRVEQIVDETAKSTTEFTHQDNGTVISKTFVDGTLRYEITHSSFGNPLNGKSYDHEGQLVEQYEYNELGQVIKK